VENFTTAKYTLDHLYAVTGPNGVTWREIVDRQKVGDGIGKPGSGATYEIGFPVFQYRGWLEEIIPTRPRTPPAMPSARPASTPPGRTPTCPST
jgi:hypothetical protein